MIANYTKVRKLLTKGAPQSHYENPDDPHIKTEWKSWPRYGEDQDNMGKYENASD